MPEIQVAEKIRNIAIIAHVDHGKTTLVDAMFRQSGIFRQGQHVDERVMDRMDLERERGITIAAKNCSVQHRGTKINIVDTPGHADFGGEVERALSMVDGAILLVDASEGPLPQTRFVLQKALSAKLKIIVVINKVDRKDARPESVLDQVYDLLIDLDADEDQLEFPLLYAIGRDGKAGTAPDRLSDNLKLLMDTIVDEIPAPRFVQDTPFSMLVSDLGYSDYLGRLAVGRVVGGKVESRNRLIRIDADGNQHPLKVTRLQIYEGMDIQPVSSVEAGEIVVLSGIDEVTIGDTICTDDEPTALPRISVDPPTVAMRFTINDGPMVGQEGKYVQSARIRERLFKETLLNVAIQVEPAEEADSIIVKGRGEFQLAILIETMRREDYEFCVGRPEVILKQVEGMPHEPIERLFVDCEETFMGVVTEKLSVRKGKMMNMANTGSGRVRLEFSIPSRALIGYRDEFLTDTRGTGIMNSYFQGYEPYRGDFPSRFTGSIVSDRKGRAVPYALYNLEPRGRLFILPGEPVYEGMIIGEHNRDKDINVNPTKEKKLTNIRAAGKDDSVVLSPIRPMTLEQAINFIGEDEQVEVTPKSIRLRKATLGVKERYVQRGKKKTPC